MEFVRTAVRPASSPSRLLANFYEALHSGTVNTEGNDQSDLYWRPLGSKEPMRVVNRVVSFLEWLRARDIANGVLPFESVDDQFQRTFLASSFQRWNRSFLAHTWRPDSRNTPSQYFRDVPGLSKVRVEHVENTKGFEDQRLQQLLQYGFGLNELGSTSPKKRLQILRNSLITILLNGAGLRTCEPFHLYVQDVDLTQISEAGVATTRIYHPKLGRVIDQRYSFSRETPVTRGEYLALAFSLQPRNTYYSTHKLHAGWKNPLLDSKDNFFFVHFFPSILGALFTHLWKQYLIERWRTGAGHPFAFVNHDGSPYSIHAYRAAHKLAIERLGLTQAKLFGTSPHSHRHAYARRLVRAGIPALIRRKLLHHASIESQVVYTTPSFKEISDRLSAVSSSTSNELGWSEILGLPGAFSDVDPLELLSGRNQLGEVTVDDQKE